MSNFLKSIPQDLFPMLMPTMSVIHNIKVIIKYKQDLQNITNAQF